ncbi:shikimate kinase [Lentzea albidocapillata]|uniref:shikimate kinase n=1 Tax=Lentzea albidocapillata TaxID=40571 RepID=UPI00210B02DD|nr:shikimate kinase [Lentzea albidocapillata]
MTGRSGTGKSALLNLVAQNGYRTVDTDHGDWIDRTGEPLWREDRIDELIAGHERSGRPLFTGGHSREPGGVLRQVRRDRPAQRTDRHRPGTRREQNGQSVRQDRGRAEPDHTREIEPLPREPATVEIDTRQPLNAALDQLAALAQAPDLRSST